MLRHPSTSAGDAHVRSDPALPRSVEQRTQALDLSFVPLRRGRFDLSEQGEEPLMQRNLFGPRFVTVIEGLGHR